MPYTHFTSENRDRIQQMMAKQRPIVEIAQAVGKHVTSIQREITRNSGHGEYFSSKAQVKAFKRRYDTKPCPKKENLSLMNEVENRIKQNHAPQQISGRFRLDFPEEPQKWVSTETIYTWVYAKIQEGADLKKHLRQGRRTRSKRISGKEKRTIIKDKVSIDLRPAEVETKQVCGHWEGDTVEGARKLGYLGTFAERKTKFLIGFPMMLKKADALAAATIYAFKNIPKELRKTFTFDNGTEFAKHKEISAMIGVKIFFAHPYHSWERGLNEHTNGLLRQYFPKSMQLINLSKKQLATAINEINNRPRKCLNFQTPAEAFAKEICALQI